MESLLLCTHVSTHSCFALMPTWAYIQQGVHSRQALEPYMSTSSCEYVHWRFRQSGGHLTRTSNLVKNTMQTLETEPLEGHLL